MPAVEVVLPFPPSSNTAYPSNAHGRHLSKKGREFKDVASTLALMALRSLQGAQRITLDIDLYFPSKRRADIDNYVKLVKDVICEVLGIDDTYEHVPRIVIAFKAVDTKNPRCVVLVESI